MLEKITQNLSNISGIIKTGNGKIPRYLYRLTSVKWLNKIQQDTFCRASSSDIYFKSKGVYMFDLMNFLKDWSKKIIGKFSLQDSLIDHVTDEFGESDSLVVLRIATSKLDSQKLKIRSQEIYDIAAQNKPLNAVQSEHLKHGAPATLAPLYRQRKCPIEYIYEGDIPIDSIEPLGQLNVNELLSINKDIDNFGWNIKETFMGLFKNTPEEKAIRAHFK